MGVRLISMLGCLSLTIPSVSYSSIATFCSSDQNGNPLTSIVLGITTRDGDVSLDDQQIAALRVLGKLPVDFRLPGSLPNPALPAGTGLLPGIEHIVMPMMENHP